MDYPPDHLADLAVHMLSEINSHQWAASLALDSAQRGTRGVTGADGCCRIYDHKQDFGQPGSRDSALYFGRDAQGYLLVNARAKCELWPSKNGRTLPVRLTRWLVHAPPGSVVRHTCDQPDCIRISHLRVGSTSENNRDAWRRGRRSPVAAKRPHKEVVSSPFEPPLCLSRVCGVPRPHLPPMRPHSRLGMGWRRPPASWRASSGEWRRSRPQNARKVRCHACPSHI